MNAHLIKIFQRNDGSLIFFASYRVGLPKSAVETLSSGIGSLLKENDRAILAPSCDFEFFNISDDQLKEMEIKPEPSAEPK
jgi:hypothetical protein